MGSGPNSGGEFEERPESVIRELEDAEGVIILLFINELHVLRKFVRAEGSVDAAKLLKPALSRGKLSNNGSQV